MVQAAQPCHEASAKAVRLLPKLLSWGLTHKVSLVGHHKVGNRQVARLSRGCFWGKGGGEAGMLCHLMCPALDSCCSSEHSRQSCSDPTVHLGGLGCMGGARQTQTFSWRGGRATVWASTAKHWIVSICSHQTHCTEAKNRHDWTMCSRIDEAHLAGASVASTTIMTPLMFV